jgi:hypothetical protein
MCWSWVLNSDGFSWWSGICVLFIIRVLVSLISSFWKNRVCLWDHFAAVCVCVYPTYYHLNAWTNPYETWYVYHGTWVHPIQNHRQNYSCVYSNFYIFGQISTNISTKQSVLCVEPTPRACLRFQFSPLQRVPYFGNTRSRKKGWIPPSARTPLRYTTT